MKTKIDASDSFEFETRNFSINDKLETTLTCQGEIPIPKLLPEDRIYLPVDEGIVICAKDADIPTRLNDIRGQFCTREGSMSMIVIQRHQKYLLIALDSGIQAKFHVWKEIDRYRISIFSAVEKTVIYRIFDTLPQACSFYRKTRAKQPIPLSKKLQTNSNIEKLIGGGIFWIWNNSYGEVMYADHDVYEDPSTGEDLMRIAQDLHSHDIQKAMIGIFFQTDSIYVAPLLQRFGYPSTQYDNYNDVLDEKLLEFIPGNRARNCDYTARRMKDFPDGIRLLEDGTAAPAWAIRGFDGNMYPQSTLCPLVAAQRIKEEIPKILEKYPAYQGRFIDVYGTEFSSCYHPRHPVTPEESIQIKLDAFPFLGKIGLMAGTEDGFEDLIDGLVYTEGLHSPSFLRIPNSGRRFAYIHNEEETDIEEKWMLNPRFRVPLWQLVYHDCLLMFPYWGDATQSSPKHIQKRILFSCLFGCAPLYSFFVKDYGQLRDHILSSYRRITAIHEKTALLPMTDYRILSDDGMIQQSVFGDRYRVTVNFSEKDYHSDAYVIPALDFIVSE